MGTVLVVEDRASLLNVWQRALSDAGHVVVGAADLAAALAALEQREFDLVLTDLRLPDGEGTRVIEQARKALPDAPIVMMTAFASVQHAVHAMKLGATDFLEKPVDVEGLLERIDAWLSPTQSKRTHARELSGGLSIVGSHPRLHAALRLVDKVAPLESTVLLLGESGTGKELFARAIHEASTRCDRPFVPVNCAALPEALIENELFGHEKGAFTGADRRQAGRFEAADGGTLLLDEIGELPLGVQAKILRVLEERTFERVGGSGIQRANVRLIAATNRDLLEMVNEGTFRADLFYRLEVFPISLPALRDRRSDVPALAEALISRIASRNGIATPVLKLSAASLLATQEFPGNVRQLSNLLERVLILGSGSSIGADDLRPLLGPAVEDDEEQVIRRALLECDGDKEQAALKLKISVRTLQRRITKHGLAGFPRYRD